jgi:hypothetical protein
MESIHHHQPMQVNQTATTNLVDQIKKIVQDIRVGGLGDRIEKCQEEQEIKDMVRPI